MFYTSHLRRVKTHLNLGKVFKNLLEFLVKGVVCKLDFAHVELADAANRVRLVHDRGRFALRLGQYNVQKVYSRRNGLDALEVVEARHAGEKRKKSKFLSAYMLLPLGLLLTVYGVIQQAHDPLTISLTLSACAAIITWKIVPMLGSTFILAGLVGRDNLKHHKPLLHVSLFTVT
jgi:hypothetical protein